MKKYLFFVFLILILGIFFLFLRPVNIKKSVEKIEEKSEIEAGYFLGEANAKSFVIFEDYQCVFCRRFYLEVEPKIYENFVKNNKLKIIIKFYPILGEESWLAAIAANCAGKQGKFWKYREILFENQFGVNIGKFKKNNLINFARNLDLDLESFESCLNDEGVKKEIERDFNLGKSLKIFGTPAFWFNDKKYVGFLDYVKIKKIIENE